MSACLPERNDLGARFDNARSGVHSDNRLGRSLEVSQEGFDWHRSDKAKGRVVNVEPVIPVLELAWSIGTQLSNGNTERHLHSPILPTRQQGNEANGRLLINPFNMDLFCSVSERDPLNPVFAEKWAELLANLLTPRIVPGAVRQIACPQVGDLPRSISVST